MLAVIFSLFLGISLGQEASPDGFVRRGSANLNGISGFSDAQAYGLTTDDKVLHYTKEGRRWTEVDEAPATEVQVSCTGDLFILRKSTGVVSRKFERQGAWNDLPLPTGTTFTSFAVGSRNDVWAIDSSGKPWKFNENGEWTATEAQLKNVAVSCDGKVFGITASNNLWEFEGAATWREIAVGVTVISARKDIYVVDTESNLYKWIASGSGQNRQVKDMTNMNKKVKAVSSTVDGALWVVTVNGHPEQFTGLISEPTLTLAERAALEAKQGGRWEKIPGAEEEAPRSVAVRGTGEVWVITASGEVKFRLPGDATDWTTVKAPVGLQQIAVACDGQTVWAVAGAAEEHATYHYKGKGEWVRYTEALKKVAVGADDRQVWGINVNNQLVYWNVDSRSFDLQPSTSVIDIAAGCMGSLWLVTSDHKLFKRSVRNSHLRFRGDDARRVVVGSGIAYVLDTKNFLYRYRKPRDGYHEGKTNWSIQHKQLRDVAIDTKNDLVGVAVDGSLVRFARTLQDPAQFGWRAVGGSLDDICMGSASSVYGLDKGTVLHYTPAKTWAVVLGVTLTSIACGCDGVVYGMKGPGRVYRYLGVSTGWERIPNSFNVASIAAGKPGELWGLSHAGEPLKYSADDGLWETYKGSLEQLSVSCEGALWGVDSQGVVWQHDEASNEWAKMGTGAKSVATGRGVYVIGKSDVLFKYDSMRKTDRWVELGPLIKVAVGDDGAVWGLSRSGRVVVVNEGSTVAPGPEVPPRLAQPNGADKLPLPEPDEVSLSSFKPGQEPEVGAADDLVKIIADRKRRFGFHTFAEGSDAETGADPEPYRPEGRDPDNPDPRPSNFRPAPFQVNPVDPASDNMANTMPIVAPIDLSNPQPGTSNK